MDKRYLELLAREYPTASAAASEIINLSALRSLPKGTEYFFSDLVVLYGCESWTVKKAVC